jgi:acetyl-CoA carboxylase biotin carboxyl carrier protein
MTARLTLDDVREILALLDDSPYDEMTLTTDRFSVSFRRSADAEWTQETRTAPRRDSPVTDAFPAASARTDAPDRKVAGAGLSPVYAALPGTFYRAPKPGTEPFVDVGSVVDDDTVVAIIETMKLMNPVSAGCRGEIVEILVGNGAMVAVGEVLMHVRAGTA